MANTTSAKKATRKIARRTAVNKARRSRIRSFIRKVEEAIASGDAAVAKAALDQAERQTGLAPPPSVGGPVIRFPLARRHREPNQGPPGKSA